MFAAVQAALTVRGVAENAEDAALLAEDTALEEIARLELASAEEIAEETEEALELLEMIKLGRIVTVSIVVRIPAVLKTSVQGPGIDSPSITQVPAAV